MNVAFNLSQMFFVMMLGVYIARWNYNRLKFEVNSNRPIMRSRKSKSTNGYVYLLRVKNTENTYKIGRTRNPKNRLRTFNVKLPFPVEYEHLIKTDDMYSLESELHNKFSRKRQNGSEFFLLSSDDVTYIKGL